MKRWSKPMIVLIITLSCVSCDQATKSLARIHLPPGAVFSFAGDFFRLQYAENTGAFLSLGATLPEYWRHLIFTALVGLFLLGLLGYLFFSGELAHPTFICLALIFAGGASNLIDRIADDGRVIDFLNIGIGPLRTGIFNVADMTITGGALFLALRNIRQDQSQDRNNSTKDKEKGA